MRPVCTTASPAPLICNVTTVAEPPLHAPVPAPYSSNRIVGLACPWPLWYDHERDTATLPVSRAEPAGQGKAAVVEQWFWLRPTTVKYCKFNEKYCSLYKKYTIILESTVYCRLIGRVWASWRKSTVYCIKSGPKKV